MSKKQEEIVREGEEQNIEQDVELRAKRAKFRRVNQILDRIFGFMLVTVIFIGCTGLGVEYILVKGPSESLKGIFTMTMLETRRFGFIPNIFLSEAEISEIQLANSVSVNAADMDTTLINLPSEGKANVDEHGTDSYGLVDEDGDGIIFENVKGSTFVGYMLIILDPTRVFVGEADFSSGQGYTIEQMTEVYDALGGVNAGGFEDDSGSGLGSKPGGLTVVNGYHYNWNSGSFCGIDSKGTLHVGAMDSTTAEALEIVCGVTFEPVLIMNGQPASADTFESGINPRTAIGQRADGAIIMLVIDGRQAHSMGATYQDVVDILLDHGVVNACNMDGGSSTSMYYEGKYVNSCSATYGPRMLPTAWLFK